MSHKPTEQTVPGKSQGDSNKDLESLSAMLDNEAGELEVRRLLTRLDGNPELAQAWERMNLVQALLHHDNVQLSPDRQSERGAVASGVAAAIAEEALPAANLPAAAGWSRPVARLAVAASVALAIFLGMQSGVEQQFDSSVTPAMARQEQTGGSGAAGANPTAEASLSAMTVADNSTAPARQVDPQARQRLDDYINSVSITREEPPQLEPLNDSPLFRLVNEIQNSQ